MHLSLPCATNFMVLSFRWGFALAAVCAAIAGYAAAAAAAAADSAADGATNRHMQQAMLRVLAPTRRRDVRSEPARRRLFVRDRSRPCLTFDRHYCGAEKGR
jgi:hypothetical protein